LLFFFPFFLPMLTCYEASTRHKTLLWFPCSPQKFTCWNLASQCGRAGRKCSWVVNAVLTRITHSGLLYKSRPSSHAVFLPVPHCPFTFLPWDKSVMRTVQMWLSSCRLPSLQNCEQNKPLFFINDSVSGVPW
jgi:hypothetical protein